MNRMIVFLGAVALSTSALAEMPGDLSDTDAKAIAVRMESTVRNARDNLNSMIEAGDATHFYTKIWTPVMRDIRLWPNDHLKNRAVFPYFSCKQAAISLLQYGEAWESRERDSKNWKSWRDHVVQGFRDDYAACKEAIREPNLALKRQP